MASAICLMLLLHVARRAGSLTCATWGKIRALPKGKRNKKTKKYDNHLVEIAAAHHTTTRKQVNTTVPCPSAKLSPIRATKKANCFRPKRNRPPVWLTGLAEFGSQDDSVGSKNHSERVAVKSCKKSCNSSAISSVVLTTRQPPRIFTVASPCPLSCQHSGDIVC